MAIPSAIGVEMINARIDEYSVPQMNGLAPNTPATGFQISVTQKRQPNSRIERWDSLTSSKPIAATMAMSSIANAPVPARKSASSRRAPVVPKAIYCSLIRSSA